MQATHDHRFQTIDDAKAYVFAGNATFTLQSQKTGTHFTYKVSAAKDRETGKPTPGMFFVKLLNGQDNESDYAYLGMVRNGQFGLTRASCAGIDAASVKAFRYFMSLSQLNEQLVVRHEGRCGRCGRTLTVPESIDLGIGPECASKMDL